MSLVGKKKPTIHRRKKIFIDANLRKQQKEQYTQVSLCVYVQSLHQGTMYSSVKPKAVTSGREVDNNWA